ncbi:HAD family hydrolase [Virgibacillus soli]|uniref:Phosphoserine phosphatase n=1 Tax=Paracerasibacillus soli TaxID=480284 RepID=A0ABU5CPG2_9BACI|nr:HAD family hydrolase [Virgibacillus soli]MDY0407727.1 HAD family hydrolase [Virgibacillus soli]
MKAIIFDLDDTLLWDKKSVAVAFKRTCEIAGGYYRSLDPKRLEKHVRKHAQDLYKTYEVYPFVKDIGIGTFEAFWGEFAEYETLHEIVPEFRKEAWTRGLEEVGIKDAKLGAMLAEVFPVERKHHPFVYEETFEVLEQLQNKYALALLTNGSANLQREKLKLTPRLSSYFDHIVISGDFGTGKPNPAIFEYVLDLLSVRADDAMMIGDNLHTDILGASRVKIPSVWINHHDQLQHNIEPTYEINRLRDLLQVIEKINENKFIQTKL